MASALGQLPNAPLIYVLAQIGFTRIPKMESYWEEFHQAIFDRYPQASIEHIRQIQLQDTSEPSASDSVRWNMLNREKTEGIILAPESLIFHATSYATSDGFFANLEYVLTTLIAVLPKNIEVNKLGLRYIDLLLPSEDLPVDEQVSGKLGSIPLDEAGCEFLRLEEVTRYSTPENGNLVIRHRQSKGADILPGDLFPNNLHHAPLLEREKPTDAVVGLMDYDHYVQLETELKADVVMEKLRALHATNSRAFELTTTPEAKSLWSTK